MNLLFGSPVAKCLFSECIIVGSILSFVVSVNSRRSKMCLSGPSCNTCHLTNCPSFHLLSINSYIFFPAKLCTLCSLPFSQVAFILEGIKDQLDPFLSYTYITKKNYLYTVIKFLSSLRSFSSRFIHAFITYAHTEI